MWLVTARTSASRRTCSPPATARFPFGGWMRPARSSSRTLPLVPYGLGRRAARPNSDAQTPELNAFTSTEVPRATSTVETISGPKSPCSTTPAVPAKWAARAAGSENAAV